MPSVRDVVLDCIAKVSCSKAAITMDQDLVCGLDMDSTEYVELAALIKKRLTLPIDRMDLSGANTVADVVSIVERCCGEP